MIYECAHHKFAKWEKKILLHQPCQILIIMKKNKEKIIKIILKSACFFTALAQCTRGSYNFFLCWVKYIYTYTYTLLHEHIKSHLKISLLPFPEPGSFKQKSQVSYWKQNVPQSGSYVQMRKTENLAN